MFPGEYLPPVKNTGGVVKPYYTGSADQNPHILLNGRIAHDRRRSFEWSSK